MARGVAKGVAEAVSEGQMAGGRGGCRVAKVGDSMRDNKQQQHFRTCNAQWMQVASSMGILVLTLVDELLKGFFEGVAELLVLLEGLVENSVQLQLHSQQR